MEWEGLEKLDMALGGQSENESLEHSGTSRTESHSHHIPASRRLREAHMGLSKTTVQFSWLFCRCRRGDGWAAVFTLDKR